jgi:thiol-disulfide isomerase/thioredoxin
MVIRRGEQAPAFEGATQPGAHALAFYKVTCPTCRMAAPALERFEAVYPGRIRGIGQDPAVELATFSDETGMTFPSIPDEPPYDASTAYGIEHVPTVLVVDAGGKVVEVVEAWDRDGFNRASRTLADLLRVPASVISDPSDGLPAFKPG